MVMRLLLILLLVWLLNSSLSRGVPAGYICEILGCDARAVWRWRWFVMVGISALLAQNKNEAEYDEGYYCQTPTKYGKSVS